MGLLRSIQRLIARDHTEPMPVRTHNLDVDTAPTNWEDVFDFIKDAFLDLPETIESEKEKED